MLHQSKRSKKSKSNNWWTPIRTFEKLCKLYKFKPELDAAADDENSLCDWLIDKKIDALKIHWIVKGKKRTKVFLNPPNGDEKEKVVVMTRSGKAKTITKTKRLLALFIQTVYLEFTMGRQIMMIVPLNVQSSGAWWSFIQNPMERGEDIFVRPIEKRIAFLQKGKKSTSSINGYCVVLFAFNKKKVMKRLKIKC